MLSLVSIAVSIVAINCSTNSIIQLATDVRMSVLPSPPELAYLIAHLGACA